MEDIDTGPVGAPDIDQGRWWARCGARWDGAGKKPSGMLFFGNALYVFVRNIQTDGTQSRTPLYRIRMTDCLTRNGTGPAGPSPSSAILCSCSTAKTSADADGFVYVVAHDNPSAYVAADRFVLMRVPVTSILDQSTWEFFSGTPDAPSWSSFDGARQSDRDLHQQGPLPSQRDHL